MPESKRASRPEGRAMHVKTKPEVLEEAARLAHEIAVKAKAIEGSPHPVLALEQLEAELEFACHLARDVRRLITEHG
jgi:hypothetical protein